MLDFSDDIPEFDSRQIVQKAIFNAGKAGKISAKSLLPEICKLEQVYQISPIQRYALATSISINPLTEIRNFTLNKF